MGQALSRITTEPASRSLFKSDRPRAIDRHIDFFGDQTAAGRDMCGEALLDALTGVEIENDEASSCD